MPDSRKQSEPKITLEAMLKFKRKENPSSVFWEKFDRELRQKTLQALMREESSSWRCFRFALNRLYAALPLSAIAILLLAFVAYQSTIHLVENFFSTRELQRVQHTANFSEAPPFTLPSASSNSSVTLSHQADFVIDVIPKQANSQQAFDKIMAPRTFTALSSSEAIYAANPLASATPTVRFVSAPSLDYF